MFTIQVDDGLDEKSTAATMRAKAFRIWDAGGWRCSKCEYAFPLTGDLLRVIARINFESGNVEPEIGGMVTDLTEADRLIADLKPR